jgi:hypothetical protein
MSADIESARRLALPVLLLLISDISLPTPDKTLRALFTYAS